MPLRYFVVLYQHKIRIKPDARLVLCDVMTDPAGWGAAFTLAEEAEAEPAPLSRQVMIDRLVMSAWKSEQNARDAADVRVAAGYRKHIASVRAEVRKLQDARAAFTERRRNGDAPSFANR